ncbi:MAG: hypothetical protein AB3N13_14165 [Arenibacterium sp.]
MKAIKKALFAGIATCAFSGAVSADVPVIYLEGDTPVFRVNMPDFWTLWSGGDRDIAAPGTDDVRRVSRVIAMEPETSDEVWLGFVVPDGVSTMAQADAYLEEIGPSLVRDPTVSSEKSGRIGGLRAEIVSGTGVSSGKSVSYTATAIDLPGSRIAIAVAVIEKGANAGYVQQINEIFGSFRSLR